jgi:hypothetical protein
MRNSPLVLLAALAAAACSADPLPSVTDGASETGTETGTGTGTDTSTTAPPTTTKNDDLCVPGSSVACTCPNGNMGAQECNADGNSYGSCECEGGGSNSNSDGTLEPTSTTTDGVTTTTTTTEGTTTEETSTTSTSTGEETTTGGLTCDDPGPEPNGSEVNAIDLGDQGCGAMAQTVEGVLDGEDDIDWFSYHGVWSGLCLVGPNTRHTLTASDGVRLCVFVDCDQGEANIDCPNGTTETDSPGGGHPGCCGEDVTNLNFNFGCGILTPNDARLFIRVDQAPADACVEYSVAYDYDQ